MILASRSVFPSRRLQLWSSDGSLTLTLDPATLSLAELWETLKRSWWSYLRGLSGAAVKSAQVQQFNSKTTSPPFTGWHPVCSLQPSLCCCGIKLLSQIKAHQSIPEGVVTERDKRVSTLGEDRSEFKQNGRRKLNKPSRKRSAVILHSDRISTDDLNLCPRVCL